jgi:hypothetical protein
MAKKYIETCGKVEKSEKQKFNIFQNQLFNLLWHPFLYHIFVGASGTSCSRPGLLLLDGESAERAETTSPATRMLLLLLGLRSCTAGGSCEKMLGMRNSLSQKYYIYIYNKQCIK